MDSIVENSWYWQHDIEWLKNMIYILEEQESNGIKNPNIKIVPEMKWVLRHKKIKEILLDESN